MSLIGIILRWGFLIWELIFYLLRTFCPHLGRFFFVLFLLSLRFSQISPLAFFRWFTATSDRNAEASSHNDSNQRQVQKFGTDPTLEYQIRIYKSKKSILDRPSGTVAQWIEALSLYGSRWALSEDSGQAGQKFTWSKTWCDRKQLW